MPRRYTSFSAEYVFQTEGAVKILYEGQIIWLPKDAMRLKGLEGGTAPDWADFDEGDPIEFSIPEDLADEKEMDQ